MTNWREFRLVKGKKTQIWKIRQDGEWLFTEHGLLNGAMQNFQDKPGDKGKENSKAYVNSVDNCSFHVEREVRKKEEHGYIEYIDGKPSEETVTSLNFDKCLPKNFCGYKPKTEIVDSALRKLHSEGRAKFTRKLDGMCTLFVKHPWGWEAYTRRMDLTSERFPNHIDQLSNAPFDVGTILIGEIACQKNGIDDFKATSRVYRSLPSESRELVDKKEVPEPFFIIFDMLFHNGVSLSDKSYEYRSNLWKDLKTDLIKPVTYHDLTPDNWESTAKENGWEGFVVVDTKAVPGDKFFSFDGDAKRPAGSYKCKPVYTEDAIVYAGLSGTGKRLNGIGSVFIAQRYPDVYPGTNEKHPEAGNWFGCGKCGSGFDDETLDELEKLFKDNDIPLLEKDKDVEGIDLSKAPCLVIELEYGERQPGSQKFRFPVFMKIRTDKNKKECYAQRLAAEEDE